MHPVVRFFLILTVVAYCCGSVPFGLLVGFSRGIDVRKAGSGNSGRPMSGDCWAADISRWCSFSIW